MAEVKYKLSMYEVDMICDKCSDGHMRPDGVVLLSDPPKYPHTCDNCGATAVFPFMYPRVMYKYKGTDREWKKELS